LGLAYVTLAFGGSNGYKEAMRLRWLSVVALLAVGVVPSLSGQAAKKRPFRDQLQTAQDGVTKGWLVESPWPDQDDASQRWRTVAWTLVIAKHGKVVRKIQAAQSFWSWGFWNGGREVVVQEGPPHGATWFMRMDVKSGKKLETWDGDIEGGNAPAWVKAAAAE
jgi:hypothetical protein